MKNNVLNLVTTRTFFLVLLLAPQTAWSEMILTPFPLSKIVDEYRGEIPEYRFVTGKVSSIGARVRTEHEYIIAGQQIKKTYEIPRVHTTREVMQHYQAQLQNLAAEKLFYCEGRDCGRSNDWANEIFRERILFGPDRFQHYLASTFTKDGRHYASVVYTIRRGNQRVYAHVEQIELASQLLKEGQSAGILVVSEEELSKTASLKSRLQNWFAEQQIGAERRVTLVTYSRRSDKASAENIEHAIDLGRSLKTYIGRELLPEDSIRVINVGPFAPAERFQQHVSFVELFVE